MHYILGKINRNIFLKSFNISYKNGYKLLPPRYVVWDCTRKCNLKCMHCGAAKEIYRKELSEEQIKRIIDELADLKVRMFAATGGEPLTRPDLLNVLKYASEKNIKTGIATNGFVVTEKVAEEIKKSGVVSVQVSLDGIEEIHNNIRGNDSSFKNAVNAIIFLKKMDIKMVAVSTMIFPFTIKSLDKLKDLLINLGVSYWKFSTIMPIGRASEKKDLILTKKNFKELFSFIIANKKEINIEMGENLSFLAHFDSKIRKEPIICPVGFTACCIGVDGNIRGCPEQPDTEKFREGSVLEQSFSHIWQNGFKKYRSREILKEDKKCFICKNKNDCFGGCWVMREKEMNCINDLIY